MPLLYDMNAISVNDFSTIQYIPVMDPLQTVWGESCQIYCALEFEDESVDFGLDQYLAVD